MARPRTSSISLEMTRTASLGRQPGDFAVDRLARADIDAARRFIKDHHTRVTGQPFADQHLLLVAAGKIGDVAIDAGGPDIEPVDQPLRQSAFRPTARRPQDASAPRWGSEILARPAMSGPDPARAGLRAPSRCPPGRGRD